VPDNIDPKRTSEPPIIDPSGRIKTPEEIEESKRAEQDRQEHNYRQQLLDAEMRQAKAQHAQARASCAIVILTGGLIIVSLISGFVSYLQFTASARNAKSAEDQAFITALTVGQTQHMLDQAIAQTRAAQQSANVASETLRASERSFRIEQRPYIVMDTLAFFRPIAQDITTYVNMTYTNIGKTPAINVRHHIRLIRYKPTHNVADLVSFLERSFNELRNANQTREKYSKLARMDIAPNEKPLVSVDDKVLPSRQDMIDLEKGDLTLFLIGVFDYSDSFRGSYRTEICHFFWGKHPPDSWHISDSHNTIK